MQIADIQLVAVVKNRWKQPLIDFWKTYDSPRAIITPYGSAYQRGPCADGSVGYGGRVWSIEYPDGHKEEDTLFYLGEVPEWMQLDAAVVVAAVR